MNDFKIKHILFQLSLDPNKIEIKQMQIISKGILSLGGLTLAGGYLLNQNKVSMNNLALRSTLGLLHNYNPKFSSFLLRYMIRFSMIAKCERMSSYVFSEGFDYDGDLLDGLCEIGFDTVEVGPVALIPSSLQEKRAHFGNKIPLGNINSYLQQNRQNPQKKQSNTKIGVSIIPNYEVLMYTPYLIEQNMLYCLKQFEQLNANHESLQVHRYILNLNQPEMKSMHSPQYLNMIQNLIKNAHQATVQTLENKRKLFSDVALSIKPQILIQIPNQDENPQLYKLINQIPQAERLIVDGSEFEVLRYTQKINRKNVEKVQLIVGKRRITFQQLLERIVNDTL